MIGPAFGTTTVTECLAIFNASPTRFASSPSSRSSGVALLTSFTSIAASPSISVDSSATSADPSLRCNLIYLPDEVALLEAVVKCSTVGHTDVSFQPIGWPQAWNHFYNTSFYRESTQDCIRTINLHISMDSYWYPCALIFAKVCHSSRHGISAVRWGTQCSTLEYSRRSIINQIHSSP